MAPCAELNRFIGEWGMEKDLKALLATEYTEKHGRIKFFNGLSEFHGRSDV
ncbi:hypothetical protein GCM10011502_00710 [Oceanisphaera marina]|uniref:Uncharacterized protein n=1 Tax=Oceanisphaera marina TaxID=2017550 RepID=A0ABQ1IA93_9GAMM|nr:hypothetical protein GCM10011502_00710 [Oceanisphaera marina]